jgi:hypothetical protein
LALVEHPGNKRLRKVGGRQLSLLPRLVSRVAEKRDFFLEGARLGVESVTANFGLSRKKEKITIFFSGSMT